MLKANERRQKILEILCVRRQETMENLAQEFNVTIRTIRNDIEELTGTVEKTFRKFNRRRPRYDE